MIPLYPLCLALAFLLSLVFLTLRAKKQGIPSLQAAALAFLGLISGLFFGRLMVFITRFGALYPSLGFRALLQYPPQGIALSGVIIGLVSASLLFSKWSGRKAKDVLDLVTAPALMMLALARFAEFQMDFGQGAYVENTALQFFPLAVPNEFGEWYFAVFMLEGLFALLWLYAALKFRAPYAGDRFLLSLSGLALSQVFCESLRAESIKWGFVRAQQLFAIVAVVFIALYYATRQKRLTGKRLSPRLWVFPPAIALLIGVEFALDKLDSVPHPVIYPFMLASLALMGLQLKALTRPLPSMEKG